MCWRGSSIGFNSKSLWSISCTDIMSQLKPCEGSEQQYLKKAVERDKDFSGALVHGSVWQDNASLLRKSLNAIVIVMEDPYKIKNCDTKKHQWKKPCLWILWQKIQQINIDEKGKKNSQLWKTICLQILLKEIQPNKTNYKIQKNSYWWKTFCLWILWQKLCQFKTNVKKHFGWILWQYCVKRNSDNHGK